MLGQFSAADSALGYLYQCRVALVFALQRIRAGHDFNVALETLDDVVFDTVGQRPTCSRRSTTGLDARI